MSANTSVLSDALVGGTYTASASSTDTHDGVNCAPYVLFNTGTGSTYGWTQWYWSYTAPGSGLYSPASDFQAVGYPSGISTTTASGTTYLGEWVQLAGPTAIRLTSYSMFALLKDRAPKDWVVLGSNDGATWTLVDSQTGIGPWTASVSQVFAPTVVQTNAYNTFRVVVTRNQGVDEWLSLGNLQFYGKV